MCGMGKLENKVAIVAGGSIGIGEAISERFAAEGAKVMVAGCPDDPVDDVVGRIAEAGGEAVAFKADLSSEIKARECVTRAVNIWGKIDLFINVSGVFPGIEEMDIYPTDAFYFMSRHNIQAVFMMTRFVLPELQKTNGAIVFTGSETGVDGMPGNVPYGATKGFVHAFAKGLAKEQAKFGVRVNCVFHGPLDISWLSNVRNRDKRFSETMNMNWKRAPEQLAEDYLFLASDESAQYTGMLFSSNDHTIRELKAVTRKLDTIRGLLRPASRDQRKKRKERKARAGK